MKTSKLKNLIQKSYLKNLSVPTGTEMDDRILGDAFKKMDESTKQPSTVTYQNLWRIIMKTKTTKFAASAALVIIIASIIGVWPEASMTSKVYGISDVPEILRNVKNIHIKGWEFWEHIRGKEGKSRVDIEEWIDIEKGRYRTMGLYGTLVHPEPRYYLSKVETINDGQYKMKIDHGFKEVEFSRLSSFKQKLSTNRNIDTFLQRISISPGKLDGFVRTKMENLNGTDCYIWEKHVVEAEEDKEWIAKYWVSPSTGELKKTQGWTKSKKTGGKWEINGEKVFEIDVDIPKEVFEFNPPTGYSLSNTKETASLDDSLIASPFMLDSVKGKIVIILSLPNGVAIMGWHLESDKPVDERIELYKNLIPGDELPKSPIEIAFDLWPKNNILDITYVNRYLAQTQKNGKFYEWGICVPNKEFDAREMSHSRKISYIHHPEHENEKQDTMRYTNCQTLIIEEDEFDTFIRGAMAELSDDGIAPDYITYENVISMTQDPRH